MSDLKCLGQLKTYINVLYQGLCQPELLDPVCLLRPDARGDDPDDVCQVSQDVSFEFKVCVLSGIETGNFPSTLSFLAPSLWLRRSVLEW